MTRVSKNKPEKETMTALLSQEAEAAPEIVTKLTQNDTWEMYDRKLVTGVFRHLKKPNGVHRFGPMKKYKGETCTTYTMQDGHQYTIPRYVADYLNGVDINDVEKNPTRTPGAYKLIHQDQHNDLYNQRPLSNGKKETLYAFTPVVNW